MKPVIAWRGGSRPEPLAVISRYERSLVSELFREQCADHINYWGDMETDTARTFWRRARYDAHATCREQP